MSRVDIRPAMLRWAPVFSSPYQGGRVCLGERGMHARHGRVR